MEKFSTTNIVSSIVSGVMAIIGIATWLMSRRKEKFLADGAQGNAFEIMQRSYDRWVTITDLKIGTMEEEIKMLHALLKGYRETCDNCPTKKQNSNEKNIRVPKGKQLASRRNNRKKNN